MTQQQHDRVVCYVSDERYKYPVAIETLIEWMWKVDVSVLLFTFIYH